MNKQIKQSILSGFAFSWTVLFSYLGFAVWSDLPTQIDNTPLNASIWNQMITTVNNIWKSQLWVDQTRQNVTASRSSGTPYQNLTWKPILVSIHLNSWASGVVNYLYVDGINVASVRNEWSTTWIFGTMTAIVPNGSTYSATLPWATITWTELR